MVQFLDFIEIFMNLSGIKNNKSLTSTGTNIGRWHLLLCGLVPFLSSCQLEIPDLNVVDQVIESDIVSGIRNLPARAFPDEFEKIAYIDRDFNVPNAEISNDGEFVVVKTYFATNRNYKQAEPAYQMFNESISNSITFGKNYTILLREPELRAIEPISIQALDISDTSDPPLLSQNNILSPEEFSESVISDINQFNNNDALIYIHGFNDSYEDAVIRAAQVSYDLGFSGPTFLFSWPARDSTTTYLGDVERAQASEKHFEFMMEQILSTTAIDKIYLITHTTGARIGISVLRDLFAMRPSARARFREIILIAPDINSQEFTTEYAPILGSNNSPVTLYTSSNSSSLDIPKRFSTSKLAGDSISGALITGRVETIDAGVTDLNLDGHSNYSDTNSILADIWDLIRNGTRANSRNKLAIKYSPAGVYWEYPR
tara:strand:- start:1903 stop:3192 length:1290 start_codon:yes stop_codon:yes gene_type:complete